MYLRDSFQPNMIKMVL